MKGDILSTARGLLSEASNALFDSDIETKDSKPVLDAIDVCIGMVDKLQEPDPTPDMDRWAK